MNENNPKHHRVAIIGDSTFFHSGLTGLLDAVASNANMTVVIVDNSITAMTGGQQHPGSGKDLMGEIGPKIPIEDVVTGLGVKHLIVTDTYEYDKTLELLKEAVKHEGPSVLIARRPCALFPKKIGIDPYVILDDPCSGCGNCLRIGCPAISISGRKTDRGMHIPEITADACTGCTLCQQVCKDDAIFSIAEMKKSSGEEVEA
ncbi:2-oxoglutarate ferredoxin oxidoreductase subunit beta [bacterium BMS3Bbin04]|nr:2-oxoglutarate ferredoxin oxidoreductase subunit beta [bacterium BMS3Bbin04]